MIARIRARPRRHHLMNRTLRLVLVGCVGLLGCSSRPQQQQRQQQTAQVHQKQSSWPPDYQTRLHHSPEKSPLRPIGQAYMDLNHNGRMDAYENPDLPIERRIDDLLSKMTLEEKTCQLCT